MIDRKALLERNCPHLTAWDPESPLSVGNGELAFTADVTGLQTFYEEQREHAVPLCTMSQWGWHSTPAGRSPGQRKEAAPGRSPREESSQNVSAGNHAPGDVWYTPEDVKKTAYESARGTVYYASEPQPGNEEIYHWLRENPHRLNLARISFLWDRREIHPQEIAGADQTLLLYEGVLESSFWLDKYEVQTETVCAQDADVLGVRVCSDALADGRLSVLLAFPYGSPDITGSDWDAEERHCTQIEDNKVSSERKGAQCTIFYRELDRDSYTVVLTCSSSAALTRVGAHAWVIESSSGELEFTAAFLGENQKNTTHTGRNQKKQTFSEVLNSSRTGWAGFWESCGMLDLHASSDPRALELERRVVLSEYLLAIQSLGSVPPAETGLTCNSWYGKFHLEMYPWHCAWAPLWNEADRLQGSLCWYREHLPEAQRNAACNGYRGARWPKMVDPTATDSPSPIAVLLIWQQPHILWMLYLVYSRKKDPALFEEYWDVIRETARFMCDFAVYNEQTGYYDLPAPLIPAQEEHDPRTTKNPAYELEYWSFALEIAADMADQIGESSENWREAAERMAPLPEKDGLYLACETCPDTFTRFNKDHPSMTAAFGLLPGKRVDPGKMRATLKKVLECWQYESMWGWDFAMLAMTAVRLGEPETAIEILLKDTPKNTYVVSGNNYQRLNASLPLYLPGNGSLLLAMAMMTAGYAGAPGELPGIPKNGKWKVEYENIAPFPY